MNSQAATIASVPITVSVPLTADVIRRAQQGEAEAFAALFHAHKSRVYSLCLRMTNNIAEAEDLAQDAFLQVFRKLSTFRGDSALSTWLHRITVNTVLMHFRRKSPIKVSLDDTYKNDGESKPVRREFGRKDGRLETAVSRLALTRAISELPEGYRTIFILHEVDGYEHREIAELLGCSVGNSKSQLHKAKLKMREMLASKNDARQSEAKDELAEDDLCVNEAARDEVSMNEVSMQVASTVLGPFVESSSTNTSDNTFSNASSNTMEGPETIGKRRAARRVGAAARRVGAKVKAIPSWSLPMPATSGLLPLSQSNA